MNAPELGLECLINDMHEPHLVCYHIWSCPLGFKLACVLSTGAS
jgi:hypothetical protein